jgi:hypothetical protein
MSESPDTPNNASATQIRKAQNRIAQREFRLRKQVSLPPDSANSSNM